MGSKASPLRKASAKRDKRRETPEEVTRNAEVTQPARGKREWGREEFYRDLYKASARIAEEIDANPEETARMERSQRDIEEGRIRWEDEETEDDKEG